MVFNWERWQLTLLDQFAYLPQSQFGFGGGTGSGGLETKTARGEGGGGGGGVRALPVGVFEVSPKETRFVAIGDRKKSLGTLLLGAGLGLLFARRKRFGR